MDHFRARLNVHLMASHTVETFYLDMQGDADQPQRQRALEQQPKMTARAVSDALVCKVVALL